MREDRNGPSMSQSTMFCAGNAAMCFLAYVLRSESTAAALHSSKGYILRRLANRRPAFKTSFRAIFSFEPYVLRSERTAGGTPGSIWCRNTMFCAGWATADDEKCSRWSQSRARRMQRMRVSWLARLGNFLQKHMFSLSREEILPRNSKNRIKSIVEVGELNLESKGWGVQS